MKVLICICSAAVLWTVSITLMAVAIINDGANDEGRAAVLVGLMALAPTSWLIMEDVTQRASDNVSRRIIYGIAQLIGRADAEDHDDGDVTHISSRR